MNVSLICVGSLKERFWKEAEAEYAKRLSRYIKLEITELKDEKTPAKASAAEEEKIRQAEGQRILSKIKEPCYVVALDSRGRKFSSEAFAQNIAGLEESSKGRICFIIGGSLGLDKRVLERADTGLSFSDMTFAHQLMRIIFLEQLYRAYRIIHGEPYHK